MVPNCEKLSDDARDCQNNALDFKECLVLLQSTDTIGWVSGMVQSVLMRCRLGCLSAARCKMIAILALSSWCHCYHIQYNAHQILASLKSRMQVTRANDRLFTKTVFASRVSIACWEMPGQSKSSLVHTNVLSEPTLWYTSCNDCWAPSEPEPIALASYCRNVPDGSMWNLQISNHTHTSLTVIFQVIQTIPLLLRPLV